MAIMAIKDTKYYKSKNKILNDRWFSVFDNLFRY